MAEGPRSRPRCGPRRPCPSSSRWGADRPGRGRRPVPAHAPTLDRLFDPAPFQGQDDPLRRRDFAAAAGSHRGALLQGRPDGRRSHAERHRQRAGSVPAARCTTRRGEAGLTTLPIIPERVGLVRAAAILGVSPRTVQRLAQDRQLPTAAKVGRLWTFNEQALRTWLVEQESKEPCPRIERKPRRAATGEGARSGRASWSPEKSTGSASRQVIQSLLAAGRQPNTRG
ncbi:helix-turn-helix domain-containing protein [Methylobacterium sp. W2]|nr:helix-turn-helix domain-containing protein [Methylobacterium sp. W2]